MNSGATRLSVRLSGRVGAKASAACPVWFSTVPANSSTRSGYPTKTASEEFLVRFKYWLVSGGLDPRIAWGRTAKRSGGPGLNPGEKARAPRAVGHRESAAPRITAHADPLESAQAQTDT